MFWRSTAAGFLLRSVMRLLWSPLCPALITGLLSEDSPLAKDSTLLLHCLPRLDTFKNTFSHTHARTHTHAHAHTHKHTVRCLSKREYSIHLFIKTPLPAFFVGCTHAIELVDHTGVIFTLRHCRTHQCIGTLCIL